MYPSSRKVRRAARAAFASLMIFTAGAALVPEASAQQQPSEQDKAEARQRYEKGKQLYTEGAFDAALAELQRSYQLAPAYKILYNIALVQRARNDFVGSLQAYEKYLGDGGKDVPAARKAEVSKEMATLRTLVAHVDIKTNATEAEILVDDVPVGKGTLASILLNPGQHRVAATKEGRRSPTSVITLAGGDNQTVNLVIPDAPAVPTATATAQPTVTATTTATQTAPIETSTGTGTSVPPLPPPERGPVWIGWALTGAMAVGAGVTGGLAMSKAGAHADLRKTGTAAEIEASRSDAKTLALVTDVLIPAAIVTGAVTLYFSVRSLEPAKTGRGAPAKIQLAASPTVGPSGMSGAAGTITGSF